jgi:hypothetical protein
VVRRRHDLERLRIFRAGRQVVGDQRVPQHQQAPVQVQCSGVIVPLHRIPELHAGARRRRQDRRDRAMSAERERRVEQRVHGVEDAVLRPCRAQEIGQELEIAGALLDPITPAPRP